MDCHILGTAKSTEPPRGAHLTNLCRPCVVHRPSRIILLTFCSDHLADHGDHLSLCCVHLACHGGLCCHRANQLRLGAAHPASLDRHRVVHLDLGTVQLAPCVGHLVGPIRQCDCEIRILDSNPSQFNFSGGCNIASKSKIFLLWSICLEFGISPFLLNAPNNAHHSSRAIHLTPHSGPLCHRVDHLFPRVDPHRHLGILLTPLATHLIGPCRYRAVLLAPRATHPASPHCHPAILLTPHATHPTSPCRHYPDRHACELRMLGGSLVTFHCLLRP